MKENGPIPPGFVAGAEGRLLIGDTDVEALVAEAGGTPLFVYDAARIGQRIAEFRYAMPDGVALHYAVKANPYGPLLTFMARHVDGFDIASIGEFERLHALDFEDLPMSFAGPGKRDSELEQAISAEVTINLESEAEAARALTIAGALGIRPKLAVRVNPPFALKGAGMKMGGAAAPFGIDHDRAANVARELIAAGADWRGLHIYAGSQALHAPALIEAQRATVALAGEIADAIGETPPEVNLGGGFGIPYFPGEAPLDVMAVGAALERNAGKCPRRAGNNPLRARARPLAGRARRGLSDADRRPQGEPRADVPRHRRRAPSHARRERQFRPAAAPQLSGRNRQPFRCSAD